MTSTATALRVAERVIPHTPAARRKLQRRPGTGRESIAVKVVQVKEMFDLGGALREAAVSGVASSISAGMDMFGVSIAWCDATGAAETKTDDVPTGKRRRFPSMGSCLRAPAGEKPKHAAVMMAFGRAETTLEELRSKVSKWGGCSRVFRAARDMWTRLAYAHVAGIAHCDIKGDNVMLTADGGGHVRFIDWGIGEWMRRRPMEDRVTAKGGWDTTHTGIRNVSPVVQPAAYRCPQLADLVVAHDEASKAGKRGPLATVEAQTVLSTSADVFAAACLSWLILTGRYPVSIAAIRGAKLSVKALQQVRDASGTWRGSGEPRRAPCKATRAGTCEGACGQSAASKTTQAQSPFMGIASGGLDDDAFLARAVKAGMHCNPSLRADAASIAKDTVPVCPHRSRCLPASGSPGMLLPTHVMRGQMFKPDAGDAAEAVLAAEFVTSRDYRPDAVSRGTFVRLLLRWCTVLKRPMRVFMAATFLADAFQLWTLGGAHPRVAACALVDLMTHIVATTPLDVSTDASGGTKTERLQWALCASKHMLQESAQVFLGIMPTTDMWLPRMLWPVVILRALCETVITPDIARAVRCVHTRRTVPRRMVKCLKAAFASDPKLEVDVFAVSGIRKRCPLFV